MKTDVARKEETRQDVAETTPRYTFTPKVDIWETAEAYFIEAELPGVDEQNVDVKVEDELLTLLGRVEPEKGAAGFTKTYAEYETGNFERVFRLNGDVDGERIAASMKHGVLRLELPKREALKPKRIQVTAA